MPLKCNIDTKGRVLRMAYGVGFLLGGSALLILVAESILSWAAGIAMIAGGAFAIFEACTSWCVIRAMGWKTPM